MHIVSTTARARALGTVVRVGAVVRARAGLALAIGGTSHPYTLAVVITLTLAYLTLSLTHSPNLTMHICDVM